MTDVRTPDQLEQVPIEALLPYVNNARTHSEAQVAQLAGSIKQFGWTNPCIIDADGLILAGHGRVAAARVLGMTQIPCIRVPLSGAEARAYILADNRLAELAGWDLELLRVELDQLIEDGFDLDGIGFDEASLAELFPEITPKDNGKDPDAVPAVPEVGFSKEGQVWVCGPHRIMCGSSTSMDDWNALMRGELADLQVCDPPYNVDYESVLAGKIKNDKMKDGAFYKFLLDFYVCSFEVLKPGAAMYVAHADSEGANFRGALKAAGFSLKACLMWVKSSLVLGRGDFHYRHEPILYGTKPGAKRRWFGGRKQTTLLTYGDSPPFQRMDDGRYAVVDGDRILYIEANAAVEEVPSTLLHFPKPKRSAMHPTTKPVALWERLAGNNARPNDIIIDGFGGSGTTMITAERLGMVARLMELDPRFVDVTCVRYFVLTGRVPVDAETGEEFPRSVIDKLTAVVSE